MKLRAFLFSMILALGVGFLAVSGAQAQLNIVVEVPETLELDQETILTIEVTEDGEEVEVDDLSVSYSPADGVFDEVVYDCNDPDIRDNCRANNRGVAGIFEAVFDLKKLPLTVLVEADGEEKEIVLGGEGGKLAEGSEQLADEEEVISEAVEEEVQEVVVPLGPVQPGEAVIAPANVQAGPLWWWLAFVPLLMVCGGVMWVVGRE